MNNYQYIQLTEELVPKLVPLYKNAFDIDLSVEQILKKFNTLQYTGKKYIAFLAVDEHDNAVALYTAFPVLFYFNGETHICGQVGDLMTHSEHRRKGLFLKLAKLTNQLAESEGIKLIFTFLYGRIASYQGFVNQLGFIHKQTLHSYNIKIKTLPFCRLSHKSRILTSIYKNYLNSVINIFYSKRDHFNDKTSCKDGYIVKNKAFFDYKFSYSPGLIIKLNKTCVWFKLTKFGSLSVGDFENYDDLDKNIDSLKRFCFWAGIRAIQIETSPGTALDTFLRTKYSFQENYNCCFFKLNESVPSDNFKFVFGDLDNF